MTEGCSPDAPDLKNHPYSAALTCIHRNSEQKKNHSRFFQSFHFLISFRRYYLLLEINL